MLAPLAPYVVDASSPMGDGRSASPRRSAAVAGAMDRVDLAMIAVIGARCIVLLVFYFLEGTTGPNRFGPDPEGPDDGQVFS